MIYGLHVRGLIHSSLKIYCLWSMCLWTLYISRRLINWKLELDILHKNLTCREKVARCSWTKHTFTTRLRFHYHRMRCLVPECCNEFQYRDRSISFHASIVCCTYFLQEKSVLTYNLPKSNVFAMVIPFSSFFSVI